MIEWTDATKSDPKKGTRVLIKLKKKKVVRLAYFDPNDAVPSCPWEDDNACELFDRQDVTHWAPINLP